MSMTLQELQWKIIRFIFSKRTFTVFFFFILYEEFLGREKNSQPYLCIQPMLTHTSNQTALTEFFDFTDKQQLPAYLSEIYCLNPCQFLNVLPVLLAFMPFSIASFLFLLWMQRF